MRRLKKVWELLLEAFFPQVCLNCQKYLGEEEKNHLVCSACLAGVEIYHNLFYPSSGITLAAASSYANPVVRELIHSLKYRGFLRAVQPLGTILATYLERLNFNLRDFVIAPVPLHPTRFRQRGFNQAELLAQAVGNYFNLPVLNSILKRIKATIPQIELTDNRERFKNLKGSFAVQKKTSSGYSGEKNTIGGRRLHFGRYHQRSSQNTPPSGRQRNYRLGSCQSRLNTFELKALIEKVNLSCAS